MPPRRKGRNAARLPARPPTPRGAGRAPERAAPKPAAEPLYLFLTEPGLAALATAELKHLKMIERRARPQRLFTRSHDVLVLPGHLAHVAQARSRICTNVLAAPIFGRGEITPRAFDRLAALMRESKGRRIVSTVAGAAFDRPSQMRRIERELERRGVSLAESGRAVWLIVVDQAFYFGVERQNHHDAPGRGASAARSGALPPTVAAAMAFAAKLGAGERVWDATAGTGNLLAEVLALSPDAQVMATDTDAAAVRELERRLHAAPKPWIRRADAAEVGLPLAPTLTIANLPFGKRYEAAGGNAALYAAVLANALRQAAPAWRGIFLASDAAAMRDAARANGLALSEVAQIKLRGLPATIWRAERGASDVAFS